MKSMRENNVAVVEPQTNLLLKNKSPNWAVISLSVFLLISLFFNGYLFLQFSQFKKQESVKPNLYPTPSTEISPIPTREKTSELISLDNVWNLYTNYRLGFSIKVPKIATGGAPCVWKGEKEGDHSYRPASGPVPVKIFEDENGIYINHEYRYKLTGETKEGNEAQGYRSFFSDCEKETITLDILKTERPQTWNIISEKVTSDQELETFIDRHFHPSCSLGEKKQSDQIGFFDVIIRGTDPTMKNNTCWLNYDYVMKYSPEKQRAFTWDIGQACSFNYNEYNNCYDQEMRKSFKIL